jgi:hypothetical protein
MSTVTIDAIEKVRDTFNFTVDKFPLSGPDGMKTPFYGLFRSDNCQSVGTAVSERYRCHQTDDVLAITEAAITALEDENIQVRTHFRDGHYVEYAPSNAERKAIYGTADNIFPRFLLRAGYDGRAFSVSLGWYRDICSNLHIPRSIGKMVNRTIRHTSGLRWKMDELINDFAQLGKGWEAVQDAVMKMESREVVMTDFLKELYGEPDTDSKRAVTVHKHRTEAIVRRLLGERVRTGRPQMGDDFKVSAWEAFNAVQGYVQHDSSRKNGFKSDMDRLILANRDLNVHKAELLALSA